MKKVSGVGGVTRTFRDDCRFNDPPPVEGLFVLSLSRSLLSRRSGGSVDVIAIPSTRFTMI